MRNKENSVSVGFDTRGGVRGRRRCSPGKGEQKSAPACASRSTPVPNEFISKTEALADVTPRWFLYLTAAVAGAAVMIVEILGAKMLSPYFGTSHFVWTAQIGVTLVSLACGYYLGGRLVDRSPRLGYLYGCLLLTAIYLCFTVPICAAVAYRCLEWRLAIGSIVAAIVLFFVPLTLLATTGPFLACILTSSIGGVGGQVGRLSAVSTLGSVVGTGLIGYLFMPLMPNSVTMVGSAGMLMLVAMVYFVLWGRRASVLAAVAVGSLLGLALGASGIRSEYAKRYAHLDELARHNSPFGLLQVMKEQNADRLFYLNDFLIQNTYDPVLKKSTSLFTYMLHGLARSYGLGWATNQPNTPVPDILCIGMGVGIVPMQFAKEGACVDAVEINPAVVPLGVRYFDLQPDRFNLAIGDGRHFLNCTAKRYDVVILDAFLGDSSPSHLMTREAFIAMRRVLKPGGVLVTNSFGEEIPGRDFSCASLQHTLGSVFASLRVHAAGNGNVFFVASDQPDLKFSPTPDLDDVHPICRELVAAAYQGQVQFQSERGQILTDDYNPVDYYDAANREQFRRLLASGMRPE